VSAEPDNDLLEELNDPKLLRRMLLLAVALGILAGMLFLLWFFSG